MLKIGDFSLLTRVSIRMLRHYNEIGLLTPVYIDDTTGYRYYSEEQLPVANRIQALKNMGLSLSIINDILNEYNDTKKLHKYLMIQKQQKMEEIELLKQQELLLNTAIKGLENKSELSNLNIVLKEIPERQVVSYRGIIDCYSKEGELWRRIHEEAALQNVQYGNPSYSIAVYHDEGYVEHDIDVEVQRSVIGSYQDTEYLKFKKEKPRKAATLIFKGSYEKLTEINREIAEWILENRYEFDGPMFNIYHKSPGTESNYDNLITEVCFPVKDLEI